MNRDTQLVSLRPSVNTVETKGIEHVQNTILRPILKFQHELLMQILDTSPLAIRQLSKVDNERDYHLKVKTLISKDANLKGVLIGCIVGLMTAVEYNTYVKNQKEINKRILTMLAKRYTETWVNGRREDDSIAS